MTALTRVFVGSILGLAALLSIGFASSTGHTTESRSSRAGQLICSLSAFFSVDADTVAASMATLEGRGLLHCRNDQGFSSEQPVVADLDVFIPVDIKNRGEIAISGNTADFIIPREIAQLSDDYSASEPVSQTPSTGSQLTTLLRGDHEGLVAEMKLSSRTISLQGLQVRKLRLRLDDSAPDLN